VFTARYELKTNSALRCGHALARTASCHSLTTKDQSVHVRFVAQKVAPGNVFLRVRRFSPVGVIPPLLHNLVLLSEASEGEVWGLSEQRPFDYRSIGQPLASVCSSYLSSPMLPLSRVFIKRNLPKLKATDMWKRLTLDIISDKFLFHKGNVHDVSGD
jgi:hypothetical protein